MRIQLYEIKEWEYCVNGERKPNCRRVISSFTVKLPYGKQLCSENNPSKDIYGKDVYGETTSNLRIITVYNKMQKPLKSLVSP